MKKKLLIIITIIMLSMTIFVLNVKAQEEVLNPAVTFEDSVIQYRVLQQYDTDNSWTIDENELQNITDIYIYQEDVKTLVDIPKLPKLTVLYITENESELDLSPLKNNEHITQLTIRDSKVSNFDVVGTMPNLYQLYFGRCNVTSVPDLSNTKITTFNIEYYDNPITDYSFLKTIPNCESVSITNSTVNGLDFIKEMPSLKYVYLNEVNVSDISPIFECKQLESIVLTKCTGYDMKNMVFENFSNLYTISLTSLDVENVTITNCPLVANLYSHENPNNKTVTINGEMKGNYIYLEHEPLLEDISSLSNCTDIKTLQLDGTKVGNIQSLINFSGKVYLRDTEVNPYDEATFHVLCTIQQDNGGQYYLGDVSKFLNTNYTTEETEEMVDGSGETITAMPVESNTSVEELITEESFPALTSYEVKVYDQNGNEKTTGNIGSRNVIKVEDKEGNVLAEYTVLVRGDVSGNGLTRIYDAFVILKGSLKPEELDNIEKYIMDYNEDEKVQIYDAYKYLQVAISQ